nr:baseplate J/gp47 family protein [Azospirillum brasilense]
MFDDSHPDGFPVGTDGVATDERRGPEATGDQLAVANHLWPLAPVTSLVTVVAPAAQPIAFTIAGVPVSYRSAVAEALAAQLRDDGSPGGTVRVAALWAAVRALGLTAFDINVPADDVTATAGHLPTLGAITWT